MDKYKNNEILLGQNVLLKYGNEVIRMAEKDSELLNTVYKEIADKYNVEENKLISLNGNEKIEEGKLIFIPLE